jgi:hypothetical protein
MQKYLDLTAYMYIIFFILWFKFYFITSNGIYNVTLFKILNDVTVYAFHLKLRESYVSMYDERDKYPYSMTNR